MRQQPCRPGSCGAVGQRGLVPPLEAHAPAVGHAADELGHVASYRFDLVDVAREVISAAFTAKKGAFQTAFASGKMSAAECESQGSALLAIIDDYDKLLSTDTNFMLGRWIAWARAALDGEDGDADAAMVRMMLVR